MGGGRGAGRWGAEVALVAVAFIWGATFVVVKQALADVSTFLFLGLRFTLAAVALGVALGRRLGRPRLAEWRGAAVCAGLLFAGYGLQTAGLRLTTASKSAFITGLYIVLVPLLGSFVQRSVPRWVEVGGAALATAGTILLTAGGLELKLNAGDWLTAGCAVAFAGHLLAVERYSRRMDYERLSLYQVAGVAGLSWVAAGTLSAGGLETARVAWSAALVAALVATALLATALSFLLYTWAQRHTSAAKAALIFALEPVFAGLVAWAVSGEEWGAAAVGGAALILAGIVLVELKPAGQAAHPED